MKLININTKNLKLSPKRLFGSRKSKSSLSASDPSSFSLGAASCSSSDTSLKPGFGSSGLELGTPTTVLPQSSGEWSDTWANGVVSVEELEALLSRLGAEPLSREELSMMLREVGCDDADGCVSLEALTSKVGSSPLEPACDAELRETFDFFDTDHDGKITAEELLAVFTAMGDERCTLEDCRRMIAGVDKNRDGFVCFKDFSLMMEQQRQ